MAPEVSYDALAKAIRDLGGSIWALVKPSTDEPSVNERRRVWTEGATASGGTFLIDGLKPTDTAANLDKIAEMLTASYRVTYARPALDKSPTKLEVKARRSGVKVLAPTWPPR